MDALFYIIILSHREYVISLRGLVESARSHARLSRMPCYIVTSSSQFEITEHLVREKVYCGNGGHEYMQP
jgi:hypothetical protein